MDVDEVVELLRDSIQLFLHDVEMLREGVEIVNRRVKEAVAVLLSC